MRPCCSTYRAVFCRIQHALERRLGDTQPPEFEACRGRRLKAVSPATVAGRLKEWRTLSRRGR